MSADERRTPRERASQQVEEKPTFAGEPAGVAGPPSGYAAGSEGGGSEIWDREPSIPGGWEVTTGRRFDPAEARRRVEARPEVMPPHPEPVDRRPMKKPVPGWRQGLPFVLGAFFVGGLVSRAFHARRTPPAGLVAGPAGPAAIAFVLRSRGLRRRRQAQRLAQMLHGQRLRGELVFP